MYVYVYIYIYIQIHAYVFLYDFICIFFEIDFEFGWSESFVTRLVFTWAPLEAWSSGLHQTEMNSWMEHTNSDTMRIHRLRMNLECTKRQLCCRNSCQMDVNVSTNLFVNAFDRLKNEFFVASPCMQISREFLQQIWEEISGVPNWSLHKCTTKRLCKHFGNICKFVDVDFSKVWLGSFPRDLRKHPTFWLSSASSRVLLSRPSRLPLGGNTFDVAVAYDVITIRQKKNMWYTHLGIKIHTCIHTYIVHSLFRSSYADFRRMYWSEGWVNIDQLG